MQAVDFCLNKHATYEHRVDNPGAYVSVGWVQATGHPPHSLIGRACAIFHTCACVQPELSDMTA